MPGAIPWRPVVRAHCPVGTVGTAGLSQETAGVVAGDSGAVAGDSGRFVLNLYSCASCSGVRTWAAAEGLALLSRTRGFREVLA